MVDGADGLVVRHMRIDPYEAAGGANAARSTCVRDRMSHPAVTILASAPLRDALRLMAHHRIHYLPVVNDAGHLVGLINKDDVLGMGRRGPQPQDALVTTAMSAPAVCVGPTELLRDAVQLMSCRGVGALPVVQDRLVVGILTQSDVVVALAEQ